MEKHLAIFYGEESVDRFGGEMADIRNFPEHRRAYIAKYLKKDFGLDGILQDGRSVRGRKGWSVNLS